MTSTLKVGILVVVALFTAGCSEDFTEKETKFENIARLFWDGHSYAAFIKEGNELKTVSLAYTLCGGEYYATKVKSELKLLTDVPADKMMWAKIVRLGDGCTRLIEIHIHNEKDINGSEWRREVGNIKAHHTETGQMQVIE
jgi:hypothetical protein